MQTQLLEQTLRSLQGSLIRIHQGFYPKEILENLGKAGAYQHFLDHQELGLRDAINAIYLISKECGNTGFCVWCQNTLAWYLLHSKNKDLFTKVSLGEALGGTGLSNPIKSFADIESIKLKATKTQGGYLLKGSLPWVSNLDYGHYFGILALLENGEYLFGIVHCDAQKVKLQENTHFIGLEGSGTFAISLEDYFLEDSFVISDSWKEVSFKVMPGFALMQTGIALGMLENGIRLLEKHKNIKRGINSYLPYGNLKNIEHIKKATDDFKEEIFTLAKTPYNADKSFFHRIIGLKAKMATLLLEVSQAVMLSAGTKGYIRDSNESKFLLESYFVAMVTPSIKHVHKVLS